MSFKTFVRELMSLENGVYERAYKVRDIVKILGISKSSAYELCKQGYFRVVYIGTDIRISKKSFDEWFEGQTTKKED